MRRLHLAVLMSAALSMLPWTTSPLSAQEDISVSAAGASMFGWMQGSMEEYREGLPLLKATDPEAAVCVAVRNLWRYTLVLIHRAQDETQYDVLEVAPANTAVVCGSFESVRLERESFSEEAPFLWAIAPMRR